jgi:hypothetical protein
MQEMVEPDRTILIVSIIGLVVIWGSVAYHKFVQGGAPVGGTTVENADAAPADDTPDKPRNKGKVSGADGG